MVWDAIHYMRPYSIQSTNGRLMRNGVCLQIHVWRGDAILNF